ncbi:28S ribosomal protein S30, mitochondrial-like [Teleopsis dalmanni]|uniref:28S ribosomal protein S30, mitochondrial-like n=1 Tax=Teleopsis dalmanni TaxID=139649 RepID=UPI000D32D04B|nr:28S ribosomal protein S30, mitochondrial-like [Teleopsis dalmanni]
MLILRQSNKLRACINASNNRCLATKVQPAAQTNNNSEYTDEPQYPEIQDVSFKARKVREKEDWYKEIEEVPTVEEKLIKINMPRYYGYKVFKLTDEKLPYNCLPAIQHYTRTIFENADENIAPEALQKINIFVEAAKSDVQDALEFAHEYYKHKYPNTSDIDPQVMERTFTQLIVEQINRVLINTLAADISYLNEVDVDYNPRHEAFWFVGGIDPPKNVVKSKKGHSWQKEMANDSVDRPIQYNGTPYLALRHKYQLPTFKSDIDSENMELAKTIPRFNYDPRTLGFVPAYQHGTNVPGFWPGARNGFGCISYQSRAVMNIRPASFGEVDFKEALHAHGIQTSYAWLLAQANYNGFNTFSELTYPMNTQTIVTNGKDWSFYEYQLNTLLVHSRHIDDNPRVNFCRGTKEYQLYQEFNDAGKCIGFNDQVLQRLVQFYINVPTIQRNSAELQPYLDTEVKHVADHKNVDKREFLEKTFKHMTSNRPRHLAVPEIYLWEKIYKIDHNTRPIDPKRRYFEVGVNPWKRTMDQHQKEYIPRACRPEGPKSKKKFKPTYYP